jgi:hypothetical protein
MLPPVSEDRTEDMSLADCVARALAGPARLRELCGQLDEAAATRKPGRGKLSAIEHVCHLFDMERDVFGVRLRRVLNESSPRLAPVSMDHFVEESRWRGRTLADLAAEWEVERRVNIELVAAAEPEDFERVALQPDVGRITFLQIARQWARHDREHLRQLEIIALNSRERNLP